MKLVIDISEETYNLVKKYVSDGITNPLKICIANGTPLSEVLVDIEAELWYEGHNFTGEYQGVWVRYKDIEKAINSHISGKEKE